LSIRQPSDSAVRAAAIDPSQSFLIQAPAGSGKTELLTDRILALLATVNRPEEIVAITFTRKAASEMHERVLAKLRAGAGPAPGEAYKLPGWRLAQQALARDKDLGWSLLDYPARLSIRTIDSFCAYLVRAMPWLSAMGGVPAITDQAREHYEAAAQATLDMADDNQAVADFIAHLDVDVRAARGLIADMLGSRDQWLPLLGRGANNEQLLESLARAVAQDLERLATAMPPGWADGLAPSLRQAAQTLAAAGDDDASPLLDWDGEPFEPHIDSLPQWQALAQALLTGKGTLRRTVTKKQGFEPKTAHKEAFLAWLGAVPDDEPWVGMLNDIKMAPPGGYTAEQERVLEVLLEVLWLAAAQLKLRFAEMAEVDFIEISQRALEALGRIDDPSDLLLSLDSSIRHILVDEFQDTSQTQIRLLELLTAGWMPDDGHTLFLVGDPMQSIYRFRKADVGGFLNVRDNGLGTVSLKALNLTENFRSQGNLVQWVNDTCLPIFPSKNHPGLGAITFTRSVPFNEPAPGLGAVFHPIWVAARDDDDDDADESAPQAGEAEALAVSLARRALEKYAHKEKPVAVLVRARGHLQGMVHRLAQEGIPCRAVELVTLESRQVVIDLAQLARALAHPADRLAWLSVLRSPLCGLTLASLHALFGHDLNTPVPRLLAQWIAAAVAPPSYPAQSAQTAQTAQTVTAHAADEATQPTAQRVVLPPDEAMRLRLAAAVLLDTGNAAGTIPFAAWLEDCWARLGGPEIYYRNPGDSADAERLFRLIEDIAPYGQLDPVDLEARLAQLYAAPENSGRAVDVMTIHKSKGLEFETVIMTGLHRRPRGDVAPLMYFEPHGDEVLLGPIKPRVSAQADPVTAYLAAREKKRAAYETDRLLYVGLTRARSELHLIGEVALDEGGQAKRPSASSLLGRLWDQLDVPPPPSAFGTPEAAPGAASDMASPAPAASRQLSTQRYLVRRALDTLADAPPAPAARVGATAMPWSWRESAGAEAVIGTVAHAWLERIGKGGADTWPVERVRECLPVFRRQLARAGLPDTGLDDAAQALCETLIATLTSERGQWLLRVAQAYREWSLLDISGRVSIIDLAISQENDWLVVDYKTGVPRPGESAAQYAERMRERYRDQIERYCRHVTALDGRPARGALYFPRADIWVEYPAEASHAVGVQAMLPGM